MKSLFARLTRRSLVAVSLLALMAGILQPLGARAQASYWIPPKDTVWQLQWSNAAITGSVQSAIKMAIIPLYTTDPNKPNAPRDQIVDLHKQNIKAVCSLPAGVVNIVNDPDRSGFTQRMWGKGASYWQDQRWLDVRNTGVRKLIEARIVYAISLGCDAIEVQWVDGYIQDTGLPITYGDQLAYNRWLAKRPLTDISSAWRSAVRTPPHAAARRPSRTPSPRDKGAAARRGPGRRAGRRSPRWRR